MAVNKPIKKKKLKKFIHNMNKNHLRISGWCKTYDDFKEFVSQKEKHNSFYNDSEVSINN